LEAAVNEFVERSKRRRLFRDTDTIQRGIIRHIFIVLDLSLAMADRDLRPSRLELTLSYAVDFVNEFFDQNPISQMGIIGMRNGIAERISGLSGGLLTLFDCFIGLSVLSLSGNPTDHVKALQNKKKLEPAGEPSLQNGLEMARTGLA
jgi:transcription initiation factor TFIIH subunit 2